MSHFSFNIGSVVLLVSALAAAPQNPAPGHRVYGPDGTTETYMVDVNGTIVHTWPGGFPPGKGLYLEADGTLIRTGEVAGAPPVGGRGGAVQRIAFDGTVLWSYLYTGSEHWAHHDIEPMPNGNVLIIAWDRMTRDDAIAAGRNPALTTGGAWLPDSIVEVQQTGPTTGNVVWEWHMMDHVIQDFDNTKANFGVVANHPELVDINFPHGRVSNGDWNHANSLDYDPVRDVILLNCSFQDEFYLIDHSTTTAQAAAHAGGNFGVGGDILYRWGNPAAYRAGTLADQKLFSQHSVHLIPQGLPGAGNVLAFNNQAGTLSGQNFSTVVELQLPATFNLAAGQAYGPSGFVWEYMANPATAFYSSGLSSAQRLPNGNTLVVSGRQNGWMFEVDAAKQKVWEYFNQLPSSSAFVFRASYYERYLWADRQSISAAAGGTTRFDMVAGSPYGGDLYVLLGSASGTTPGVSLNGVPLPLNIDGYTIGILGNAGGPAFPGFVGTLDAFGRSSASLTLPPLPGLGGLSLHHAYAVVDATTLKLTFASNAVPLVFVP